MGFLDQLRDKIIGQKRPQPADEPKPQPPPVTSRVAAQPDSPWVTAWLDEEDFTDTGVPYRPGEWFPLAQFRMPEDRQVRIKAGERRIRMYLKGRAVFPGGGYGTPTARSVSVPHLVRTKQTAPTLPALYHPEVAVWAHLDEPVKCQVMAINYETGTITFEEPAGASEVEVYYTHGEGQFRFRVVRELGGVDDAAATVFNGSFSALHHLEQANLETMWAWPSEVNLVPGMRLSLEVYTPSVPMVWNNRAEHYLHIYAEGRRLNVIDRSYLVKMAELAARNNL